MDMDKIFNKLGFKGVDRISGYRGVIESVSFDIYGCVQYLLRREVKDNDPNTDVAAWYDEKRIRVTGKQRVIKCDFKDLCEIKGPAKKPDDKRAIL